MSNAVGRPAVWTWFVVYCVAMALLYLACAVGFPFAIAQDPEMTRQDVMILGGIVAGVCVAFAVPFAIAPFLPRRSWVWIYDVVLICFGMTSVCCLPITIPLLIFWLKPETQAYFGRGTVAAPSPPAAPGMAGV